MGVDIGHHRKVFCQFDIQIIQFENISFNSIDE